MVIWITGLSGSGKTTLSYALKSKFEKLNYKFIQIDGDVIREIYNDRLGYSLDQRIIQIQRIQKLTKFLSDQNLNIIVSALYSNPELLKWNRDNFKDYFEIYIKAEIDFLVKRDKRNVYFKENGSLNSEVVGVDIEFLNPEYSDFIIESKDNLNPQLLSDTIIDKLNLISIK